MKKYIKVVLLFLLTLTLVACGKNATNKGGGNTGFDSTSTDSAKIVVDDGRKIIYNVYYTLEGKKINDYQKQIESKLNEYSGYVETMDTSFYTTCTYRVPKAKLDDFVSYIDSFEGLTNSKSIKTEDITSSYNSYQARKEVLEASRATYVAMLSQEGLSVYDVISINDKIEKIDIELKEIYLTLDTYEGLVDYSTVTIRYYEKGDYKEPTFLDEYGDYLANFFITIGKVFLYLLPIAFIGGIVAIITVGSIKHHKNKKNKDVDNNNKE